MHYLSLKVEDNPSCSSYMEGLLNHRYVRSGIDSNERTHMYILTSEGEVDVTLLSTKFPYIGKYTVITSSIDSAFIQTLDRERIDNIVVVDERCAIPYIQDNVIIDNLGVERGDIFLRHFMSNLFPDEDVRLLHRKRRPHGALFIGEMERDDMTTYR